MNQLSIIQSKKCQDGQLLILDESLRSSQIENLKFTKINELIQAFIAAHDVRQSLKNTNRRTLKQYFTWINYKSYNLSMVHRPQIIEYKTDLLNSGLTALTIGSYISSVRRFYEWCESENIYLKVAMDEINLIINKLEKFRDARHWDQFHNINDLALAIPIGCLKSFMFI